MLARPASEIRLGQVIRLLEEGQPRSSVSGRWGCSFDRHALSAQGASAFLRKQLFSRISTDRHWPTSPCPRCQRTSWCRTTQVERDGAGFVVPAILLAEAFGLTGVRRSRVDAHRRPGHRSARPGWGTDAGRWRLTFRYINRALRFTCRRGRNDPVEFSPPVRDRSSDLER